MARMRVPQSPRSRVARAARPSPARSARPRAALATAYVSAVPAPLRAALATACVAALLASCAPAPVLSQASPAVRTEPAAPPARAEPSSPADVVAAGSTGEEGMASWYGPGFAGRLTASGEIFDPNDLTAAHRTLPFGTRVRVTNLRNGRSVVVRINDRGPFKAGRVIDLSRAAAEAIGLVTAGVARVVVEPVTGASGVVRAAVGATLRGYEVVTAAYPVGTLLIVSGLGDAEPVIVRVVGNDPGVGEEASLLMSAELHARMGGAVVVQAP